MLPIRLGKVLNPLRNGFSKLHVTTPKILRLLCRKKPVRGSPQTQGPKYWPRIRAKSPKSGTRCQTLAHGVWITATKTWQNQEDPSQYKSIKASQLTILHRFCQVLRGKVEKNMEQKLVPLDLFEKWEEMHSRSQVFLALSNFCISSILHPWFVLDAFCSLDPVWPNSAALPVLESNVEGRHLPVALQARNGLSSNESMEISVISVEFASFFTHVRTSESWMRRCLTVTAWKKAPKMWKDLDRFGTSGMLAWTFQHIQSDSNHLLLGSINWTLTVPTVCKCFHF